MVAKPETVEPTDKELAIAELTGITESTTEVKQEPTKPVIKEVEKEESKELPKEEPKVKTEEEIRKEVERELKHKYLSQVSIKAKEVQTLKDELAQKELDRNTKKQQWTDWEIEAEDYIESITDAKIQKQEINKQEKQILELDNYEKQEFIKNNSDAKSYLEELDKIKSDNPNLSWNATNTLYLALNNPQALIPKTTNLDLWWTAPKSVFNPEITLEDLRKQAMEETNQWARY